MKNISELPTVAPDDIKKPEANEQLKKLRKRLFELQNLLYAEKKHALLIVLQGMDTAGKDGTIRHVFTSVNPQGCRVHSFKTPTPEEYSHDFLWRIYAQLPEKGMMQIFNRSQYEDVLFPVVHHLIDAREIHERRKAINDFEEHLQKNDTVILKFYLHISEKEQKLRLEARLTDPDKRWKYSAADKKESKKWDDYMVAYQQAIDGCGKHNPWVIVPSDQKWYRDHIVATVMVQTLEDLKMKFPGK